MPTISPEAFTDWLLQYGRAWERRDPAAAAALFTPDAEYYWTPFDEPKRGRNEIASAWNGAVNRQRDVRFCFTVLGMAGNRGLAQWRTKLVRIETEREVEIDGVLQAVMTEDRLCRVFREWWHSSESHS